jgi:hypothetical protein
MLLGNTEFEHTAKCKRELVCTYGSSWWIVSQMQLIHHQFSMHLGRIERRDNLPDLRRRNASPSSGNAGKGERLLTADGWRLTADGWRPTPDGLARAAGLSRAAWAGRTAAFAGASGGAVIWLARGRHGRHGGSIDSAFFAWTRAIVSQIFSTAHACISMSDVCKYMYTSLLEKTYWKKCWRVRKNQVKLKKGVHQNGFQSLRLKVEPT